MNYIIQKSNDMYLHDTKIENIFLNEYMPLAPGDYVKVFLYAYMYAENMQPMSNEEMANQLNIPVKTVEEAWNYWESMLAIKKHKVSANDGDYVIEFLELKAMLYGSGESSSTTGKTASLGSTANNVGSYEQTSALTSAGMESTVGSASFSGGSLDNQTNFGGIGGQENYTTTQIPTMPMGGQPSNPLGNDQLKLLFNSLEHLIERPLDTREVRSILELHEDFGMPVNLIEYGFKYGISKGNKNFNYNYAILNNWVKAGISSIDEAEGLIEETDEKHQRERRVMKALGFNRAASEAESKMLDSWFDEMGFKMDTVLEACGKTSGIPNPNFNYVNKVLENWHTSSVKENRDVNEGAPVSRKVLNAYYDYLRQKAENDAEARKREIYAEIPQIEEIDKEIKNIGVKMSMSMITKDSSVDAAKLKQKMDNLVMDRAILLTENNYEMDYTEVKYTCEKCKDTGMTDEGAPCTCIQERRKEAANWQKRENIQL